jgi:hypothetical protein
MENVEDHQIAITQNGNGTEGTFASVRYRRMNPGKE